MLDPLARAQISCRNVPLPYLRLRFQMQTTNTVCFLCMLSCVCMHSKAWHATRVSLWLARMPRPARARRSSRLRSTLAAALVLYAHDFGPCHMEKTKSIGCVDAGLGPKLTTHLHQQLDGHRHNQACSSRCMRATNQGHKSATLVVAAAATATRAAATAIV